MRQGVRCVSGTLQSKRHGAFQREARPCRSIRGLESRTRRLALMAKRRGQHCRRLQRESAAASRSCAGAFTRSSAGRSAAEAFRIRPCIRWRTAHRRRHRQLCAGRPPLCTMTACASQAPSAALCWSSAPAHDDGMRIAGAIGSFVLVVRPCARWRHAHRRRHRQLCAGRPPLRAMSVCASQRHRQLCTGRPPLRTMAA